MDMRFYYFQQIRKHKKVWFLSVLLIVLSISLVFSLSQQALSQAEDTISSTKFLGPIPYSSQKDSPFFNTIRAGTTLLENFEDGLLNTVGVSSSQGDIIPPGWEGLIDSVDGDDGLVDGSGLKGHSFFAFSPPIIFTFDSAVLRGLPTRVGIVWTDGGGTTTFEAFDDVGAPLGTIGPVAIADDSSYGTTGDDHFFGVVSLGGISAIKISNTSGGIEVDHLQYGSFTKASAKVSKLHFVKKNESGFEEIEGISYNEPFYIKAVFDSPPEEDEKTVTLDCGEGSGKEIIVKQQTDNKEIYLSDVIYVKRPASPEENN